LRANKSHAWRASISAAAATREVKNEQNAIDLGWFGLFIVLSGRFPTGSSLSAPESHCPNDAYHL
jgi:hypothetical protein